MAEKVEVRVVLITPLLVAGFNLKRINRRKLKGEADINRERKEEAVDQPGKALGTHYSRSMRDRGH